MDAFSEPPVHASLWTLLMLEFWHRTFIDGGALPQNPASDRIVA